jgi:hypothetical protein
MFNQIPTDPTAGERARQIREFPEQPRVITDPTDPRYSAVEPVPRRQGETAPARDHEAA